MKDELISKSIVFSNNGYGSNLVCIALENELIFVDAGLNTEVTTRFRKRMEEKFNRKTSTLILTHGHIDHFFGMGAFSDVEVVAAKVGKPRFERIVNATFTEEIIDNMAGIFPHFKESVKVSKTFMPNVWVEEEMTFGENQEVVFKVVGGHSSCSSEIHYIPENIVMVGDLVQVDLYPYFGEPDTDMDKWIEALKSWEESDTENILAGHGRVVERSYITGVRTFFEEMLMTLKELKKEGVSEEEITHHPRLPTGYWPEKAIRKNPYNFSIVNLFKKL